MFEYNVFLSWFSTLLVHISWQSFHPDCRTKRLKKGNYSPGSSSSLIGKVMLDFRNLYTVVFILMLDALQTLFPGLNGDHEPRKDDVLPHPCSKKMVGCKLSNLMRETQD